MRPATPGRRWRRPARQVATVLGAAPGRGRLHLGGDRGRQPGRARPAGRAAPKRPDHGRGGVLGRRARRRARDSGPRPGRAALLGVARCGWAGPGRRFGGGRPGALEELLTAGTALVSVMLANNEVGTVQPVGTRWSRRSRRLAPARWCTPTPCRRRAWLDVAELAAGCDLVSVSAHKLGRPQGGRCAWWSVGHPAGRRSSTAAARSGTAGAAPTTWPGRSAWPPPWAAAAAGRSRAARGSGAP